MVAGTHKGGKSLTKANGRRERERTRHRMEILEAAEAVFTEKGFHGASMLDIAERADFAVGTLYTFFRAKDELYEALFEEKVKEMEARVRKALEGAATPLRKVERFIDVNVEIADAYSKFFNLYLREIAGTFTVSPMIKPSLQKRQEKYLAQTAGILHDAMEEGIIRRMDPRFAALALMGIIRGCGSVWVQDKSRIAALDLREIIKTIFYDGALTERGRRIKAAANRDTSARGSEQ